jgi:hypothetical protein
MLFQVLRRGDEFDQCPSCQRLLYYRPVPKSPESAAEPRGTEEAAPDNGT